jgi:hypothetical protein
MSALNSEDLQFASDSSPFHTVALVGNSHARDRPMQQGSGNVS